MDSALTVNFILFHMKWVFGTREENSAIRDMKIGINRNIPITNKEK